MSENNAPVRFIRLGVKAGYLETQKILRERGLGFPSHPLVDRCLMEGPKEYKELADHVRVKELLAYPGRKEVFRRGEDIVDARTGWIIPHSEVPREAFGEGFIGLYIVPEMEERGESVIVHPKSAVVRHNIFPASFFAFFLRGERGVVDDDTKIPDLQAKLKGVGKEMVRALHTRHKGGIFTMARAEFITFESTPVPCNNEIFAGIRPDENMEVVGVPRE